MVKVELETSTLSVLIAGLYCTFNDVNSIAIPESIWLYVTEQLEHFLPKWNYDVISFEDWVKHSLVILPKPLLDEEDIKYLKENTLYTEMSNGNIVLVISIDVQGVNRR